MTRTWSSQGLDDTRRIAGELAVILRGGSVVALEGDLGAGKTTLVRMLVGSLGGCERSVSSPTFVLMHVYSTTRGSVYHLDAYRVGGPGELEAIGFDEIARQPGIVLIEWAGRVRDLLPPGTVWIRIEAIDATTRIIRLDTESQ